MILRQLRSSERTPSAPSHLKRYHSFTMDPISSLNTFLYRVLVCPNVSMPTNISNALQRVVKVFVKYLSMLQEQLLWSIERRSPSFALFCRQLVSFHIFLHSPFVPLFNSSEFFYHLSYSLYFVSTHHSRMCFFLLGHYLLHDQSKEFAFGHTIYSLLFSF